MGRSNNIITRSMLEEAGITSVDKYGIFRVREMNKVGHTELYTYATIQKHLDKATHSILRYIGATLSLYIPETGKYLSISLPKAIWAWHYGICPEGYEIDHIDTNSLNNSIDNLRLVTPKENQKNLRNWPMFTLDEIEGKSIIEVEEMITNRIKEYEGKPPLSRMPRIDTPKQIAKREKNLMNK